MSMLAHIRFALFAVIALCAQLVVDDLVASLAILCGALVYIYCYLREWRNRGVHAG